jgi:DNA-binding response OmpR family regulator
MTPPKVLVVEDEALLAMTLQDWLEDWGFEVVGPAMTLAAATELASSDAIDVAILDVNVGGLTSYGVAELLAQRGIPYLFATGYGAAAQDVAGPEVAVLHKPYRDCELRAAMDAALRRAARDQPPA